MATDLPSVNVSVSGWSQNLTFFPCEPADEEQNVTDEAEFQTAVNAGGTCPWPMMSCSPTPVSIRADR